MELKLRSPTTIWLPEDNERIRKLLTYTDLQVQFQIKKLKESMRWNRYDNEYYKNRMEQLQNQLKQVLVKYDPYTGEPYTYTGLADLLHETFGWSKPTLTPAISTKLIPWANMPPDLRYYQRETIDALRSQVHGAASLPTGTGKTMCILYLVKENPVKTIIVTPYTNITNQIYDLFCHFLGKKYVGKYGDGKKEYDKLITISTAQSLAKLPEDSEAYKSLSEAKTMIFDEAHFVPCETMEHVCLGLCGNAINRYFFSATHVRGDGSELLLRGITGPIAYSKTFPEMVEKGFLKKPIFKLFTTSPYGDCNKKDVKSETRKQIYENPNVNKTVGAVVSLAMKKGRQVLIIIEEFKQFVKLINYLTVPFEFVHGGVSQDAKDIVPEHYWVSDTKAAIDRFNAGETKVLIGTSAISTGVDLKPVGCLIYLQGGISEIKIKQGIGRGTRMCDNLKDFWVVDFNIMGSKSMERHYAIRKSYYEEMGPIEEYNV
jgi:superfamily II DNA or RNA helicase